MAIIAQWDSGPPPTIEAQGGLGTVTVQTAGPSNPPGPNLIRNNTFELGDTGWGTNSFIEVVVDAAVARSGGRVLRMNVDNSNRFPLSERYPTLPGRTYAVIAHYRREAGTTPITVAPLMATWDAAGTRTLHQPPTMSRPTVSSGAWLPVTWEFTTPAGAVEVAFSPWAGQTAGCVVDVDDVTAYETSAFPQSWLHFDQVGSNNLAARFPFGADQDEFTCRFYYQAPPEWVDGSAHFAALQTAPGPTTFDTRLTLSGSTRPGVIRISEGAAGTELAATNPRTFREGRWHRVELQYTRNRTAPVELRTRIWRTGADIRSYDSGWVASPGGNATAIEIRLGFHQDLSSGQGTCGVAHVLAVDELTIIGRHASDPLIPAHHRYSVWQDDTLIPAKAVGVWNGTAVVPVTEASVV